MKIKSFIWLFIVLSLFSCKKDQPDTISTEAKSFLDEVLGVMEENFIRKKQIDWRDFKEKVYAKAGNAKSVEETYPAIQEALILLNENHTFFLKPDGTALFTGSVNCFAEIAAAPSLPSDIGYVKVSSFSGTSAEGIAYANGIQTKIRNSDTPGNLGWIVDLRGNGGGNMWPMIAGIGPLLGNGTAGAFVTPDYKSTLWGYNNGIAFVGTYTVVQVSNPYTITNPNPKIAVLIDNAVGSSGEITAIAFIGKAKTRLFGSPSCGLTTANTTYTLSNKSSLILTTAHVADRTGKTYGSSLIPDEIADNTVIISKAIEWIKN